MIVYLVTNIINNKKYIGITTKTLKQRIKTHRSDSKRINTYFYRAIRKYGFEAFRWEIIDTASSKEELETKERYYIKLYNTFNNPDKGYNSTSGGYNLYDITDDLKKIRSIMAIGENNPMFGVPSPMKGKIFSEEHRKNISQALLLSLNTNYAGSRAKGNNPAAQKVRNVETKEVFETLTDAGEKYNTHRCNIGNACRKGVKAKGFHWEYIS